MGCHSICHGRHCSWVVLRKPPNKCCDCHRFRRDDSCPVRSTARSTALRTSSRTLRVFTVPPTLQRPLRKHLLGASATRHSGGGRFFGSPSGLACSAWTRHGGHCFFVSKRERRKNSWVPEQHATGRSFVAECGGGGGDAGDRGDRRHGRGRVTFRGLSFTNTLRANGLR